MKCPILQLFPPDDMGTPAPGYVYKERDYKPFTREDKRAVLDELERMGYYGPTTTIYVRSKDNG